MLTPIEKEKSKADQIEKSKATWAWKRRRKAAENKLREGIRAMLNFNSSEDPFNFTPAEAEAHLRECKEYVTTAINETDPESYDYIAQPMVDVLSDIIDMVRRAKYPMAPPL